MNSTDWWRHAAVFVAAIGQVGFVGVWMTRRWWKHWVTRAIMAKSFTLMLLVVLAAVHYALEYVSDSPPWSDPPGQSDNWDVAEAVVYWLVALSIWAQFIALLYQIRVDGLTKAEVLSAQEDVQR